MIKTWTKYNSYFFIFFYSAVFTVILYKVLTIPATHDEMPTALRHIKYSYWEITRFPEVWPTNHILNTLLTKLSVGIFGLKIWAIRLPNLLGFIIFSVTIYKILTHIVGKNSYWFIPISLLFISNIYLLDFFGLCRGYALSIVLAILSIAYFIEAYKNESTKHIWLAICIATLSSYANFTMLYFWVASVGLTGFYFLIFLRKDKKMLFKNIVGLAVLILIYLWFIYGPITIMQSTDQFRFWSSNGFYIDTLISTAEAWLYMADNFWLPSVDTLANVMIATLVLNVALLIYKLKKESLVEVVKSPLFILTTLVLLTVFINLIHNEILGTPNLKRRTALFYFVFFIALFAVLVSEIKLRESRTGIVLSATLGILTIVHLVQNINFKNTWEWWYDENTYAVIEYLDSIRDGKSVKLATSWFYNPSIEFHKEELQLDWLDLYPWNQNLEPNTDATFYYVFTEKDVEVLSSTFSIEKKYNQFNILLRRK